MDRITVEVSQFMTTVTTGDSGTAVVRYDCYLNPSTLFTSGRLGRLASLYERFHWDSIQFEYVPTSSVQNSGQLFMAIDLDPEDNLAILSGTGLLNAVSSLSGSRFTSFPIYSPAMVKAGGTVDFPSDLFIDPDRDGDRWAYAGRFMVGTVSGFPSDIAAGVIYLRAKITFSCPTLEFASGASGSYWFMNVRSPTDTYPWGQNSGGANGNNIVMASSNQDILYVQKQPGGTTAGSFLVFGDPGVYKITYYVLGTALTSGTLTLSSDCAYPTNVPAVISGQNPLIAHPSGTATYMSFWVSVNKAGGWIRYSQSGTHGTAQNTYYLDVALTSIPINAPIPPIQMKREIDDLAGKLKELRLQSFRDRIRMNLDRQDPQPLEPGSTFDSTYSSTSVTEGWNVPDQLTTCEGSGLTIESGPPLISSTSKGSLMVSDADQKLETLRQGILELLKQLGPPLPASANPDGSSGGLS